MRSYKFDLKQGIGKPSRPIVSLGESIKRGQLIADIDPKDLGVPLHSSVTGTVLEINEESIVIESNENNGDYLPIKVGKDYVETVRNAGIIGMGGAGFPSYVKLATNLSNDGYIICNAAECEPILEHNIRQIELEAEKLIKAIRIAKKSTGASKAIIGIKLKNKDAIGALRKYIKPEDSIRFMPLKNIYPAGDERALIKTSLNILLDPEQLPLEANCVVFNVETLIAIYDAIEYGKPSIDKYITVAGNLNKLGEDKYKVVSYPIGTYIDDLIEDYGGVKNNIGEILIGGPHTGHRVKDNESICKISGSVIATDPFDKVEGKLGIIQCACGPSKERLYEIARSMEAEIVGSTICKNAKELKSSYKCEDPGNCPGQAEKVLEMRRLGADELLIGHCTDCSNTVMQATNKIGMKVHHGTDHALRAMSMDLIREIKN